MQIQRRLIRCIEIHHVSAKDTLLISAEGPVIMNCSPYQIDTLFAMKSVRLIV